MVGHSPSSPETLVWHVKLLGNLEVSSASQQIVRFRSRTALSLLAFLSLHKNKEWPCEVLQELFWPESDGDRQAQNLRRAVADLRKVLECDLPFGSVVITRKSHVALNSDRIATDVERFQELSSSPDTECQAEAVSLYTGALLTPLQESWVLNHRDELEERFAQAVDALCSARMRSGANREAIRIARHSASLAPLREDIHIVLIRALREAGMEAEAVRQFSTLESILDDHWGEPPSERAVEALEGKREEQVQAKTEPDSSGGALPLSSSFYVRRQCDDDAEALLSRREGVILIQGPRQVGKSSLLARSLSFARASKFSVVFTDIQAMGESQLADESRFYRTLAYSLAAQLGVSESAVQWSEWLGSNGNLDRVLASLLELCDGPVCWAIDEADLLFDRPYTNDIFGLLRSWHNRRALDPAGPWTKLTIVLTYATEAHLFISDLNQSPFNVGVRLSLKDFSPEDVGLLSRRYGVEVAASDIYELTRGHPHLTQLSCSYLSRLGTVVSLRENATLDDGPFGSHLSRTLVSVAQNPQMLEDVKHMLRGEPLAGPTSLYRLQSAGVVSVSTRGEYRFRVPIDEIYLRRNLI